VREYFDLQPGLIYLNSANLSICPRPVAQAIESHRRKFEQNPTVGLANAWEVLWNAQRKLAAFLGAEPTDLFLRNNVTAVFNHLILGSILPCGSEILVGEHEYGAIVNICRLKAKQNGLGLRVLKMPASVLSFRSLTQEHLCQHIVSQLNKRTALLVLSHVTSGTGLVLPLAQIAAETKKRGILFIVDGSYAVGERPIKLAPYEDVDAYASSLYKWMLGPKGTAFGWMSSRIQDRIRITEGGWGIFEDDRYLEGFGDGSGFARAMAPKGCHDFAPFFAIEDLISFWKFEYFKRMETLQSHLESTARRLLDWMPLGSGDMALKSRLSVFLAPQHIRLSAVTLKKIFLEELGIQIHAFEMHGRVYIMFSAHIYNTEEEITKALEALGQWYCGYSNRST
jgi:isopenicillin-N epimerase